METIEITFTADEVDVLFSGLDAADAYYERLMRDDPYHENALLYAEEQSKVRALLARIIPYLRKREDFA